MGLADGFGDWAPLLDGEERERARRAVASIADALEPDADRAGHRAAGLPETLGEPSLAHGQAGLALLFDYLDRDRPGAGHDRSAATCLDRAIAGLAEPGQPPGLFVGFTGVAWAVEQIAGPFEPGDDDPDTEIDSALAALLARDRWEGDYDLINGLVGIGLYALGRWPAASARPVLEAVIGHLADKAEEQRPGITWKTPPELIWHTFRSHYPDGHYNLGVSHGVPGVIALLAGAAAVGAGGEAAPRLVEGAVSWLLAQRLPPGAGSAFAFEVAPGREPKPARLAWCYGDLGIAAALLAAARSAGEPAWEREAVALALAAGRRPHEADGVKDAGFCHGAAGNGHLFNRLFQATGEAPFAAAARAWFGRALAMLRPGEGPTGVFSYDPEAEDEADAWSDDPGFLTGAAGVALALTAATGTVEPTWDRALMVSELSPLVPAPAAVSAP